MRASNGRAGSGSGARARSGGSRAKPAGASRKRRRERGAPAVPPPEAARAPGVPPPEGAPAPLAGGSTSVRVPPPAAVRRVVLGVTGSIAAYKAAEIVRLFVKAGVETHCILTASGAEFITPLTLGTLSGQPVTTGMFSESTGGPYQDWGRVSGESGATPDGAAGGDHAAAATIPAPGIRHIQVSRESGLILVAPATANILGKAAHGIADDSLSTAIMASSVPVLFAPAMNTRMWECAANQANVRLLLERGFRFVWPGSGDLACGELGTGRMADPEEIVAAALRLLDGRTGPAPAPEAGGPDGGGARRGRVLVTAGRTEEDLDPVRFLSNRSSGRMGFAVAEAARDRGWGVTLIAGPTSVPPPAGVDLVPVRSAREMAEEVRARHEAHEILVMAAAVADYRPRRAAAQKIASGSRDLRLELEPTEDILLSIRGRRPGRVTVGFALETRQELDRARRKLARKGVDFIVCNNPLRSGSEFGGETNEATLLHADGREEALPLMTKRELGGEILARAEALLGRLATARSAPAAGRREGRARRSGGRA